MNGRTGLLMIIIAFGLLGIGSHGSALAANHTVSEAQVESTELAAFTAFTELEEQSASLLQMLIDRSEDGDTVIVPNGIYEGPIHISKPITLQAETVGAVTLINTGEEAAITIEADQVRMIGIRIDDQTFKEAPSVLVRGHGALLEQLHIVTGSDGIKIVEADHGTVRDSTIEWGAEHVTAFSEKGNGIDLYDAHQATIAGNTIRNVYDGIYLEMSDDTLVKDNHIEQSRYGVHCMYTKRTTIRNNTGSMNITGAMVMAVSEAELIGNTFTKQSENVNSQGILLFDAHQSTIKQNVVEGNRVGFYIEYSTDNRLERNVIHNNFIGIQLLESEHNTITDNRVTGNVTDALASGSADNNLNANFWDSFSGIDADGDGLSDTRYAMNPFFQGVIKKRPAFQLFFQSPGMVFLESLYETDREAWTTDHSPLMTPPSENSRMNSGNGGTATGWIGGILTVLSCGMFILFRRRLG